MYGRSLIKIAGVECGRQFDLSVGTMSNGASLTDPYRQVVYSCSDQLL
jgi:hypothetical protein